MVIDACYLPLVEEVGHRSGGGILLILGVLLDFLWENIGLKPGYTCFRYLFLSVPVFMYLKGFNGKRFIPLVTFSMIYLILMLYSDVPLYIDPILPDGWEAQTSLGYFYTLCLFLLLSKFYTKLKTSKLKQYITHVGTISWEVFLVQMILLGSGVLDFIGNVMLDSIFLRVCFKIIAALFITLTLAELYSKYLSVIVKKVHKR